MTGTEDLIEKLTWIHDNGQSFEKMGRVLNLSAYTIRRWVRGVCKISPAMETLLRMRLQHVKVPPKEGAT